VDEVIVSGCVAAATVKDTLAVAVCCAELESLTITVIGKLPLVVGVPEMMPVLAARLSPLGRLPEVIDQTKGAVPPVAVRAFE
jgi:hypothetical protein